MCCLLLFKEALLDSSSRHDIAAVVSDLELHKAKKGLILAETLATLVLTEGAEECALKNVSRICRQICSKLLKLGRGRRRIRF